MRATFIGAGVIAAAMALAACNIPGDTGYVEIRTVPASSSRLPTLYLNSTKLDAIQKGVAILSQRAGTAKLSADNFGGQVALCDIVVRKNRITTVTVSLLERPPRCQCRNGGGASRVCVS
jgi:hypothetical protein